jgi:hypothetical protein
MGVGGGTVWGRDGGPPFGEQRRESLAGARKGAAWLTAARQGFMEDVGKERSEALGIAL